MISFSTQGPLKKTESFLNAMSRFDAMSILNAAAAQGTAALAEATPVDTGLVASSWYHKVTKEKHGYTITWYNHDIENGFPVAIMLQYGYGTGTGGYVQGRDYINPAIQPVFDKIAEQVWKVVTSA